MKVIKTASIFIAAAFFLAACNTDQATQVANTARGTNNPTFTDETAGDVGGYVNDDFDLQRVGDVLARSKTPQEFETYLNQPDGINNLDLNGDGYVDYISVDEFGGQDDYERGLSLFTNYGQDRRQELGTVNFYRDEPRYPGARVMLTGNDNIYGDNNFYETNWLEKSIGIVSLLFRPRREEYRSPYYYNNYPTGYTPYNAVETPYYRTRVEQMYPQPVFAYTTTAPVYYSRIKIESPNNGLDLGQIYGKLRKPTTEQAEFFQNNPRKPFRAKDENNDSNDRNRPGKSDDFRGREKKDNADKKNESDKPKDGKPDKADKQDKGKGDKPDQGGKNKGKKP